MNAAIIPAAQELITSWVVHRLVLIRNSILLSLHMESRRPSKAQPTHTEEELTEMWKQLMTRVFLMMETARGMFFRLAMAEYRTKSHLSEKKKYVQQLGDANNFCIHPAARVLKRGNQYANWTVCGVCGSRLTYKSKDRMTPSRAASKAAPKAAALTSTTQLPTPPLTWAPQNIRGYQEAPDCDTRRSQAARASSSSEPLPMRQFETFMQNLMQGLTHQQGQMGNNMAQLGSALQELARGQNQMLSLLQQTQVTFPEDASMISAEVPQQTQGLMPTAVASTTGTSEPWELMTESGENPNQLDSPDGQLG